MFSATNAAKRFAALASLLAIIAAIIWLQPSQAQADSPNPVCPSPTIAIAKWQWTGTAWSPESGSDPSVSVSGSATSAAWSSTVPIQAWIKQGGNTALTEVVNGATGGVITNAGLVNDGGQTAELSNLVFCFKPEAPTPNLPTISVVATANCDGFEQVGITHTVKQVNWQDFTIHTYIDGQRRDNVALVQPPIDLTGVYPDSHGNDGRLIIEVKLVSIDTDIVVDSDQATVVRPENCDEPPPPPPPPPPTTTTSTTTTTAPPPPPPPPTTTTTTIPARYICELPENGPTRIVKITVEDPRYPDAFETKALAREDAATNPDCREPEPTTTTTTPPTTTVPSTTSETLPFTGSESSQNAMVAVMAVVLGGGLLYLARNSGRHEQTSLETFHNWRNQR